jgi:hypothetical protein
MIPNLPVPQLSPTCHRREHDNFIPIRQCVVEAANRDMIYQHLEGIVHFSSKDILPHTPVDTQEYKQVFQVRPVWQVDFQLASWATARREVISQKRKCLYVDFHFHLLDPLRIP